MRDAWDRPLQRGLRLALGLVLFGLSLSLFVQADLGADPWTVFSQGLSRRTGLSIGTVTVLTSVAVLGAWVPLRQRPGVGTIANALVVGPVLDLGVAVFPEPTALGAQLAFVLVAIVGAAIGTGFYIGAGWGPGPRDGLMTGFAERGIPIGRARVGIEVTVLVIGLVLGGVVGVATALYALGIGPLVQRVLPRLSVGPRRCVSQPVVARTPVP